jgi:hypothetical protein
MDAHDFVTFSADLSLAPLSSGPSEDLLRAFLADYTEALRRSGCDMVGHIKGMAEDGESPPLFFSITSTTGPPQLKGGPLGKGGELALSITVIVSGVEERELSRLLYDSLAEHFICRPRDG